MFSDILPDSIIKRLSIRARSLGAVNLGQGIPSFSTSEHIISAVRKDLEDPIIGVYPNFLGILELRQAIVHVLNKTYKKSFSPETNVLITVGAMEATAASILALISTGDRVGVIMPDYCNHMPQILLARGVPVEIPCDEKRYWQIDFEYLEKEARKGLNMIILTNPNNPAGSVCTKNDLDLLVALSAKYGFWILSDETYSFLSYNGPFTSILSYAELSERVLCIRSFSKEYAMTGWRVGYVVGSETVIHGISKVHDALTGCAPKVSQRAALAAITGNQNFAKTYVSILKARRDLVCELLDQIPSLSYVRPLGAYYIFPRYNGNIPSVQVSNDMLESAGVAVVPGSAFGAVGEHHIRISFAVEDTQLREGVSRIKKYYETGPV